MTPSKSNFLPDELEKSSWPTSRHTSNLWWAWKCETMSINTYGHIGTVLFWIGAALCITSIVLFFAASSGISIGNPDGLHRHDTYWIMLSRGQRLILLIPTVAAILLILSGLIIRRQLPQLDALLQGVEEVQKDTESKP